MSTTVMTFLQSLPPWLPLVLAAGAFLVTFVCLVILVRIAIRVRAESRSAREVVQGLKEQVSAFESGLDTRIQQNLAPFGERLGGTEREMAALKAQAGSLENAIAETQKDVDRAAKKFEQFEEYFRSVFEKELRFAFRSFDETLGGVLKEMKGELLRGINRIDQIQAVVNSRTRSEQQLLASEHEARRLLKSSADAGAASNTTQNAQESAPSSETPEKS